MRGNFGDNAITESECKYKIYGMEYHTQNQTVTQTPNYLKFKNLPKQIQQRLLERQIGKGDGYAFKTAGILSAPFFIAATVVWMAIVFYFSDDYLWRNFQIVFFAVISLGAFYLLLFNLYRLFQWFTSLSKSYLLITPLYIIEMRFNDVRYWDLDQLNGVNGVRQYQSNKSVSTKVTLSFEKGATKTFDIKGIESAEQTIEQIYYYKKLFAEATARNDAAYLDSNDDFLELKNHPRQLDATVPNGNLKKILTVAASIFLTAGMMFGATSLNNYYDDVKSWNAAASFNRASSYRTYLQTHPQGRWAGDAQEKVQNLYDVAEQKYQASLNKGYDQKAADAVLQTLKYAKTTQNHRVKVVFERHNEIPSDIVEQLKKEYGVKKILPFDDTFSEDKMIRRESNLLTVVTDAFRKVIPDDILEFSSECVGDCVTFLIKYKVSSKDSIYYDPREKKLSDIDRTWNPGIFIDWDFSVRTPNQPQTYDFSLTSLPANHITYDSNAVEDLSGKVDVEKEMLVDKSNLYDAMVSSAFDDFKANLVYRMGIGVEPKPKDQDTPEVETAPIGEGEISELLMLRKLRKMTGALGVLACIERRFDEKKRSRDIEVEFYRNAFSRFALMASGTLALQSVA